MVEDKLGVNFSTWQRFFEAAKNHEIPVQQRGVPRATGTDANAIQLSRDGVATGLVVLALKRAGVGADNPKLKKAVTWLTTRQKEGTWPVIYLKPREPNTNVGRFLRDAGTVFASLALMESDRVVCQKSFQEKKKL